MRRSISILFTMILMFSFCFVLQGLTQETKETEGMYTIKKGDTLWDISSKFLKDPFLWPKLWERNPYITNPHLIFPGNPIRLSAAEPVKKEEPKEEPKKVVEEKPKEPVKEAEVKKEESTPPPEEKKAEVVAGKRPAKVEEKPLWFPEVRDAGFLSDVPYPGIGIILESKDGKSYMSHGDTVYLAFRTSEPILIGNKYTVLRASREIRHPVTARTIGRKYNVVGNIQIIDQHGSFFTARVIESFNVIEAGDLIQPYSKEKMEGDFGK